MEAGNGERIYLIEVLLDEQRGWEEMYHAADRDDADRFWRGVLDTQPGKPVRMIEAEVVRSYAGQPAATPADRA